VLVESHPFHQLNRQYLFFLVHVKRTYTDRICIAVVADTAMEAALVVVVVVVVMEAAAAVVVTEWATSALVCKNKNGVCLLSVLSPYFFSFFLLMHSC
jgi:hypothetical protein